MYCAVCNRKTHPATRILCKQHTYPGKAIASKYRVEGCTGVNNENIFLLQVTSTNLLNWKTIGVYGDYESAKNSYIEAADG